VAAEHRRTVLTAIVANLELMSRDLTSVADRLDVTDRLHEVFDELSDARESADREARLRVESAEAMERAMHRFPVMEQGEVAKGYAGCFDGFVTQLADEWLGALDATARAQVEIFSCGPTPMLEALAKVAARHQVPCQVSLEEFMACAVGGCAGCTVKVMTPDGPAMKRVCVDGPVFDSQAVFG